MTSSPITAVPASTTGAIAGFSSTCTECGMVLRSSLESIVRNDTYTHAAWHAKQK